MNLIRFSLKVLLIIACLCCTLAVSQDTKPNELELTSARKLPNLIAGTRGQLMMIGGGLKGNNRAVFEKMIECAGGVDQARFVVLPAASTAVENGRGICEELGLYGIHSERARILNVSESNAARATHDPAILDFVRSATAVYMIGGDQRRLVRSLMEKDGSDTPLLQEMRRLYERGGLIAGTSAGASAQSQIMLAASGLPGMQVDEGLDTLDYGLTNDVAKRGLLLTRGLGFHHPGIVDQHFLEYRGRLGRLTRATAESGIPYGFGIDKNSAMLVKPDGRVVVVSGHVMIVDPKEARGQDGPCGYEIRDVSISLLSEGDAFDPETKKTVVAANKSPLLPSDLAFNGNFLIGDIGSGYAITSALISGLAENHRKVQEGVVIKFHGDTSHGYRYVFRKHEDTQTYLVSTLEGSSYSVLDVRLDIVPIANGLRDAATQIPRDLPDGPQRALLSAIAFRGLLTTNDRLEFRPDAAITRREFACALARSTHLNAPLAPVPTIDDVDTQSMEGDEILCVVGAGLMSLELPAKFSPHKDLNPADAAFGLEKLARLSRSRPDADVLAKIRTVENLSAKPPRRAEIGHLLHRILELPE